ncbi:hypothetical protein GC197_17850 [bacterium]|nr:hypothetical protein [bacterium]
MYFTIIYQAEREHLVVKVNAEDIEVIQSLVRVDRDSAERVFGAPSGQSVRMLSGEDLACAADALIGYLQQDARNSTFYYLDYELSEAEPIRGATQATGLLLDGQAFQIEAGFGRCDLMRANENEKLADFLDSPQDLRGEYFLDHDHGRVEIRRIQKPISILEGLRNVSRLADASQEQTITIDIPASRVIDLFDQL